MPIFRIFDYNKAVELYVDWLGFKIDWEHKVPGLEMAPWNAPCFEVINPFGNRLLITEVGRNDN